MINSFFSLFSWYNEVKKIFASFVFPELSRNGEVPEERAKTDIIQEIESRGSGHGPLLGKRAGIHG